MEKEKVDIDNVDKTQFFTDLQKAFEKGGVKVSRATAKEIFDKCFEAAMKAASVTGSFRFSHGMGAMKVRHLGASVRRNPKSGDKINVPPRKVFRYVAGKEAKALLGDKE